LLFLQDALSYFLEHVHGSCPVVTVSHDPSLVSMLGDEVVADEQPEEPAVIR
jgi:hypothetical protein